MLVEYTNHKGITKTGIVRKENFYCKAGAYDHKMRVGWVLEIDGEVVLGGSKDSEGYGAYRYDYPEHKTRKSLLAEIELDNFEQSKVK